MLLNPPQIFANIFFHNFGSRYIRKPFKVSKDADFGLVLKKNLSQKMNQRVGVQGQINSAVKTCPHCDVIPRKPQIQSENIFFRYQLEDLLNP